MTRSTRLIARAAALAVFTLGSVTPAAADDAPVAIAIHAGAGTILRADLSAAREAEIRDALASAVRAGHSVLVGGGSSLDAVTHELDASIMDGSNLDAGAIAGVHNVRNPILLARRVMTDSVHVMLSGSGAEAFAREQGLEFADDAYFHTDYRWQQLQDARAAEAGHEAATRRAHDRWLSTVGAVALDRAGNLAAATSTGGMTNKRWGRIGDAPIIGAGTYADNRSCAVSATGPGEYFLRATVARDICARVQFTGVALKRAADDVINGQLRAMGGDGGIIAIDRRGEITLTFNTPGMYRARIDTDGELFVGIYQDED
ncbi:MAG: isoaspartyl peptidase/L-asparaginase [Xanthomonadales bacterium]